MRSSVSFLGYFAEFWHLIILQAGKQVTEARRQLSSLAELKKVLTYHTYTPPSANLPVSLFKCLESNLLNCKPTEFCKKYEPHRKAEGISQSSCAHGIIVYLLSSLMLLEQRSSSKPCLALQSTCFLSIRKQTHSAHDVKLFCLHAEKCRNKGQKDRSFILLHREGSSC